MSKIILICCVFLSSISLFAQKKDSIRVVIALDAATDKIERSYGYWDAREALDVKMDMYGFVGGKHLYKTFDMTYDVGEDAWVVMLPKGYFELRVESLGFKNINFPYRLKKDHRDQFNLDVDSVSHTYFNNKRYNYIQGTVNFCATVVVHFGDGDPADQRTFLQEALNIPGMEFLNVLRVQKIKNSNSFLVTLDIADRTALNVILYKKVTRTPEIPRGLIIGGDIAKAIEIFQKNPNVLFANPSFIDGFPNFKNGTETKFRNSAKYTKSEELERKLLRLMEEDGKTFDRINYIIDKTTPKDDAPKEDLK